MSSNYKANYDAIMSLPAVQKLISKINKLENKICRLKHKNKHLKTKNKSLKTVIYSIPTLISKKSKSKSKKNIYNLKQDDNNNESNLVEQDIKIDSVVDYDYECDVGPAPISALPKI